MSFFARLECGATVINCMRIEDVIVRYAAIILPLCPCGGGGGERHGRQWRWWWPMSPPPKKRQAQFERLVFLRHSLRFISVFRFFPIIASSS